MSDRKVFHDSVVALPEQHGATPMGLKVNAVRPESVNEKIPLSFSLSIPQHAHDELESIVERGETISPKDLKTKYAVAKPDVEPLVAWLKKEGFEVKRISEDRTSVFAEATAAQIEKSLQVNMVGVTKDGITYTAARNAPSLPANVAASVHAIGGLQPFRHPHRQIRRLAPKNRQAAASTTAKGLKNSGRTPSPNVSNAPPYLVSEILRRTSPASRGSRRRWRR